MVKASCRRPSLLMACDPSEINYSTGPIHSKFYENVHNSAYPLIGRHPDEDGCLALIFQVTTKYAGKQNKCRLDDLTEELWKKLREQKVSMQIQLTLDLYAQTA